MESVVCQKMVTFKSTVNIDTDVNPLTPMSDQDKISPYNIDTISSRQVMRIKKNINQGIISWSNTKFSKLTSQELYDRQ